MLITSQRLTRFNIIIQNSHKPQFSIILKFLSNQNFILNYSLQLMKLIFQET